MSLLLLFHGAAAAGGRVTKNTRAAPLGTEIGMGWRMAPPETPMPAMVLREPPADTPEVWL